MSGRLPDDFLNELKSRVPIVALVVSSGVPLKRVGGVWQACCPFHSESTPSFKVFERGEQHFHCFGCGAHGDVISFVMKVQGVDFLETIEQLAKEVGMTVPKPVPTSDQIRQGERAEQFAKVSAAYEFALWEGGTSGPALSYLIRNRGIKAETVEAWGLGYASGQDFFGVDCCVSEAQAAELGLGTEQGFPLFHNRITFPIRDRRGNIVGMTARALSANSKPKYLNNHGLRKDCLLYGIDKATPPIRDGKPMMLVVVEGQLDTIVSHQAGFTSTVAALGSSISAGMLEELWHYSPSPILCFDGDGAGRKATSKAIRTAIPLVTTERTLRVVRLPLGGDPASYLAEHGDLAYAALLENAEPLRDAAYDELAQGIDRTTPEGQAQFRKALEWAARSIADRVLGSEYLAHWRERFFSERRNGVFRAAPLPAPVAIPRIVNGERAEYLVGLAEDIGQASADFAQDQTEAGAKRLVALVSLLNATMQGEEAP